MSSSGGPGAVPDVVVAERFVAGLIGGVAGRDEFAFVVVAPVPVGVGRAEGFAAGADGGALAEVVDCIAISGNGGGTGAAVVLGVTGRNLIVQSAVF